jgi:hypothetical protein
MRIAVLFVLTVGAVSANSYLMLVQVIHRRSATMADALIMTTDVPDNLFCLIVVPLVLFDMVLAFGGDYPANWVVRQGGRNGLWLQRVLGATLVALTTTILLLASTLMVAPFWTDGLINFDNPRGLFASATEGLTIENPSLVTVIVFVFLRCFLLLLITTTLWSLLDVAVTRKWIAYLGALLPALLDGWSDGLRGGLPNVFSAVSVSYETWLPGASHGFVVAVVVEVLLLLLGLVVVKRKDLLRVH